MSSSIFQKVYSSLPYYTVTLFLANMLLWLCFKLLNGKLSVNIHKSYTSL